MPLYVCKLFVKIKVMSTSLQIFIKISACTFILLVSQKIFKISRFNHIFQGYRFFNLHEVALIWRCLTFDYMNSNQIKLYFVKFDMG